MNTLRTPTGPKDLPQRIASVHREIVAQLQAPPSDDDDAATVPAAVPDKLLTKITRVYFVLELYARHLSFHMSRACESELIYMTLLSAPSVISTYLLPGEPVAQEVINSLQKRIMRPRARFWWELPEHWRHYSKAIAQENLAVCTTFIDFWFRKVAERGASHICVGELLRLSNLVWSMNLLVLMITRVRRDPGSSDGRRRRGRALTSGATAHRLQAEAQIRPPENTFGNPRPSMYSCITNDAE